MIDRILKISVLNGRNLVFLLFAQCVAKYETIYLVLWELFQENIFLILNSIKILLVIAFHFYFLQYSELFLGYFCVKNWLYEFVLTISRKCLWLNESIFWIENRLFDLTHKLTYAEGTFVPRDFFESRKSHYDLKYQWSCSQFLTLFLALKSDLLAQLLFFLSLFQKLFFEFSFQLCTDCK